jgi:hypothetical protein
MRIKLAVALLLAALLTAGGPVALAETAATLDGHEIAPAGRSIAAVIEALRRAGIEIAYSNALVSDSLEVQQTAADGTAADILHEVLAPHALGIERVGEMLVVTRAARPARDEAPTPAAPDDPQTIPELIVLASRYEIRRNASAAPARIDRGRLELMSNFGDDPVRAVQRLPGVAADGASAQARVRGSSREETIIVLNGQPLSDPFHVRNYQNLFSAIDARAVDSIEVFTGAIPVGYSSRFGGAIVVDSLRPEESGHTEIGLSVFNTSLLSAGRFADDRAWWLASARRGNLDLVLKSRVGEPDYTDLFVEAGWQPADHTRFVLDALIADDRVLVVTESDPDERAASTDRSRYRQLWLRWEQQWSGSLSSTTALSVGYLSGDRFGEFNDPEKLVASTVSRQRIDALGLRQHWRIDMDRSRYDWGFDLQRTDVEFDYAGDADYFGAFARFDTVEAPIRRRVRVRGDLSSFAAWVAGRYELSPLLAVEAAFRWDTENYSLDGGDDYLSRRLSLLYAPSERTDVRLIRGRQYQLHGASELQVRDGVSAWSPAERSDQWVAGVEHRLSKRLEARLELYRKDMRRIRPRFENALDPLAILAELQPDRVRVAPRRARAEGVELSLNYAAGERVDAWASYVRARVVDSVDGRQVPRSWDQRHALQLGVGWHAAPWRVGVAVSAHSGWPRTALVVREGAGSAGEDLITLGPRNEGRFGSYATVDLRVSREFDVPVGSLLAYVELSNATDRRNACCTDFDAEFDDGGALSVEQLNDYWWPRLPAIGFLWQF